MVFKRFLVFAWDTDTHAGGLYDIEYTCDDIIESVEWVVRNNHYDFVQIFDTRHNEEIDLFFIECGHVFKTGEYGLPK